MIKVIIFDNNDVLTSSYKDYTSPEFAKYFGIDEVIVKRAFNKLAGPADLGLETTDEFFVKLCHELGVNDDTTELWKIYKNGYRLKPGVREILFNLKKRYPLALLTNFNDAFDYFDQNVWHYDEIFGDRIFVSAKLGMVKPNKDIYLYTLDKLGIQPSEAVFIDDNSDNVQTAKMLGIKSIIFKDIEQLKSDLKVALIPEDIISPSMDGLIPFLESLPTDKWQIQVGSWTVQDIVAHMIAWDEESLKVVPMCMETGHNPWKGTTKYDNFNQQATLKYKDLTPDELLGKLKGTRKQLVELISHYDPNEIRTNESLLWLSDAEVTDHARYHLKQLKMKFKELK